MQKKLNNHEYRNVDEWVADVRLTFANAMLFNPADHLVHQMAKSLKTAFDKKLASVLEKLETRSFVNDGSGGTLGPAGDWPRKAKAILKSVMEHPQSFPFNEPVDWKKLKIPDYPKVCAAGYHRSLETLSMSIVGLYSQPLSCCAAAVRSSRSQWIWARWNGS